jgi:hypothetical protein
MEMGQKVRKIEVEREMRGQQGRAARGSFTPTPSKNYTRVSLLKGPKEAFARCHIACHYVNFPTITVSYLYDRLIETGHTVVVPHVDQLPFLVAEKLHASTGVARGEIPLVKYLPKPQI